MATKQEGRGEEGSVTTTIAKWEVSKFMVADCSAGHAIACPADRSIIARVSERIPLEESLSYARLIAAAPELLEALENTTQTLRLLLVPMDPQDADARAEVRNEIKLAEAAIRKAKGESL